MQGAGRHMIERTRAGLASYVYTRDLDRSVRVSEGLEYGMVGLNTGLISTEAAPFGGARNQVWAGQGPIMASTIMSN